MGTVTEATKDNFDDLISKGLVLVDVWGPDCRPCLALMPHVEEMAAQRPDLSVVKLEAPKARRLCMKLRVMGLPAFVLFSDGEEMGRINGADLTPASLKAFLDDHQDTTASS